jgi:hypothetical protein
MTLKFKEWENVNEEKLVTSVKNWFSRAIGGAISKLDSLLSAYKRVETKYFSEWEEIVTEIDALQISSMNSDMSPAEGRSIDRLIQRKKNLLDAIKNKQKKELDVILAEAKIIIGEDKRLSDYWEREKTHADLDVAKKMYDMSKSISDQGIQGELYRKYKSSLDRFNKADEELSKKYRRGKSDGSSISPEYSLIDVPTGKAPGPAEQETSKLYDISKLPLTQFEEESKSLNASESKKLAKICTDERNKLYVQMDLEIDKINSEIDRSSGESYRDEAARKISKVKKDYLEKIREYRTKITIAKKEI